MSPRSSDSSRTPAGPYRKPRANVYTMMLLVALLGLIIGTVFLYLETKDYGPNPYSAVFPASGAANGPQPSAASRLCFSITGPATC